MTCNAPIKPAHSKQKYCKACRSIWKSSNAVGGGGTSTTDTTDTADLSPQPPQHYSHLFHLTPNCVFHALNFLTPEEALLFATVNKSWLEASKYPTLHFRQEVTFISSIFISPPLSRHPKALVKEANKSVIAFLSDCTRLRSLELPFMSFEALELLRASPPTSLRSLSILTSFMLEDSESIATDHRGERAILEMLSALPPTLQDLQLQNFKSTRGTHGPPPIFLPLLRETCQNLKYLNISGSSATLVKKNAEDERWSTLVYFNNLRSVGEFIKRFDLAKIEEINIANTSLSGTREDVEAARSAEDLFRLRVGCRKGHPGDQHPSFASRDFVASPLRVNAFDGHRLSKSVTLKCAICHEVIAKDIRSYMKAPPQQDHISYEILFDFVGPSKSELPRDDLTFGAILLRDLLAEVADLGPGVPEEMLDQQQVTINCRNNCHHARDQFLIAGQNGFIVNTRDYKYSAAVGEGLCYEADD
ncbi:hypothetical protein TrVE_jg7305 [Triparma verrucosa]|uniref:F-box domain-containing protein n=1 Tax=Triparma verrucosa TaxID=1606542 RepID=A0A9W7C7Z9_9STRA|nr:hypothetical protein TrVE_jg7305 [Triparma verrucosa]